MFLSALILDQKKGVIPSAKKYLLFFPIAEWKVPIVKVDKNCLKRIQQKHEKIFQRFLISKARLSF